MPKELRRCAVLLLFSRGDLILTKTQPATNLWLEISVLTSSHYCPSADEDFSKFEIRYNLVELWADKKKKRKKVRRQTSELYGISLGI